MISRAQLANKNGTFSKTDQQLFMHSSQPIASAFLNSVKLLRSKARAQWCTCCCICCAALCGVNCSCARMSTSLKDLTGTKNVTNLPTGPGRGGGGEVIKTQFLERKGKLPLPTASESCRHPRIHPCPGMGFGLGFRFRFRAWILGSEFEFGVWVGGLGLGFRFRVHV